MEELGDTVIDNVVAGYDVFRYDSNDEIKGYPINKDHYIVLNNTNSDDKYLVVGPIEGDHQWLAELPKIHPEIEITELPEDEKQMRKINPRRLGSRLKAGAAVEAGLKRAGRLRHSVMWSALRGGCDFLLFPTQNLQSSVNYLRRLIARI